MDDEKVKVSNGGVGFCGILFLIFLWLKLNPGGNFDTPIESWSWWWVTAPLWGPFALVLAILVVVLISMVFLRVLERRDNGR